MGIFSVFRRFFITRKCVLCKEPISYDLELPFCADCHEKWESFTKTTCHKCGYRHTECTCVPSLARDISKNGIGWCYFYDSNSKFAPNNLVFRLKREYNRDIVEFIASEISKRATKLAAMRGFNYKNYVVTYAPRRKNGRYRYGIDQSKMIAKEVAKNLGIEMESCLYNVGSREQKRLTKRERKENATKSYVLKRGVNLENKSYFLVDDIITTGSTMKACADLLYSGGAKDVIPLAYAKDN